MSAIAGLWRLDGRPDAGQACTRMLAAQQAYGPDASDYWDDGSLALGRALFRLLPEDVHDRQPLIGAGGDIVLVADVRLDNRDDLAVALGLPAHEASLLCDAAVLLAAFERWGEACLDRLVGDYAFAVWDGARRRLLLARDPLGQRPLHYHRSGDLVAFASMPKGLHALPEIPRAPDEGRVIEFVALIPEFGSRTCFEGVERVEAGHIVAIDGAGLTSRRHWAPERRPILLKAPGDYEEELRRLVDQAVKARLRGASGAVGSHLSAGLDSSVVTGTAAQLMRQTGGRVVAFTSVPNALYIPTEDDPGIADEGPLAAATAAMHSSIEHVLVRNDPSAMLDSLDLYFHLFEQPVRDLASGQWWCAINAAAKARGLSVMLPAYVGNLTLSYSGFDTLAQQVQDGHWLRWARDFTAVVHGGHMSWKGALAASFGPFMPAGLWVWINRTFANRQAKVTAYSGLNPNLAADPALMSTAHERDHDFASRPRIDAFSTRLWALRRIDRGNFNKGMLGGWGLDQRDPLTDRRLVEFCLNIPAEQRLRQGKSRALARSAFSDRVPVEVLGEVRRGRQSADWYLGVDAAHGAIAEEIDRLGESSAASTILDVERLRRLVAAWPPADKRSQDAQRSYRAVLSRSLAVGHFLRKASGANR